MPSNVLAEKKAFKTPQKTSYKMSFLDASGVFYSKTRRPRRVKKF